MFKESSTKLLGKANVSLIASSIDKSRLLCLFFFKYFSEVSKVLCVVDTLPPYTNEGREKIVQQNYFPFFFRRIVLW